MKLIISNFNIDKAVDDFITDLNGFRIIMEKKEDGLLLEVETMAPPAIYHYSGDDFFFFSTDFFFLESVLSRMNINLHFNKEVNTFNYKKDINVIRSCDEIEIISNYKKIYIHKDGSYELEKNIEPFTVDLCSEEGINILFDWIKKYKKLINNNNITPTLTGGVDTRILSYFWRNKTNLTNYYLKDVKEDGKNCVTKGIEEIKIAEEVLSKLGLKLNRLKYNKDILSVSGLFTENTRREGTINNPNFIYDFVSHHYSNRELQYGSLILPFLDNLYLKLKHPETNFMRCLLLNLLCPDLMDIRLYGFSTEPVYYYKEKFSDLNKRVNKFIEKFNLRDRLLSL